MNPIWLSFRNALPAVVLVAIPAPGSTPAKRASDPQAAPGGPGAAPGEAAKPESIPAPSGDERRAIGETVRAHLDEITSCYDERLAERPKLSGKLMARFDIAADGTVTSATVEGVDDPELIECVTAAIREWKFERPKAAGKVRVAYPLVLRSERS